MQRINVTSQPAAVMQQFGLLPSRIFTTRAGGLLDAWSMPCGLRDSVPTPAAAPFRGSPYGAAATGASIALVSGDVTARGHYLYAGTPAGLRVWRVDRADTLGEEVDDHPAFAMTAAPVVRHGAALNARAGRRRG